MPEAVALACDASIHQRILYIAVAGCLLSIFLATKGLRPFGQYGPENAGLLLSYLAQVWMNHWFVLGVYLLPWYCPGKTSQTAMGAQQTLIGLAGLVAGSLVVRHFFNVRPVWTPVVSPVPGMLRNTLFIYGLVFYLVAGSITGVQGLAAVFSNGQELIVVALILGIWEARRRGSRRGMIQLCLASCFIPIVTVLHSGFLGFGIIALIPIVIFTMSCWGRVNWPKLAAVIVIGGYLGLSLFVNYFRDRSEIRRSVWGNDRLSARLDTLNAMFHNFEWFSVYNTRQLDSIDGRLNQNWLVGAGVVYIENTKQW